MWVCTIEITDSGEPTVAESFADFLRTRRGNLSHESIRARALANGEKISVTTLSKIERGIQTAITAEKAEVLARALMLSSTQRAALMRFTTPEAKSRENELLKKRVASLEQEVGRLNARLDRVAGLLERLAPPDR